MNDDCPSSETKLQDIAQIGLEMLLTITTWWKYQKNYIKMEEVGEHC